MALYLNTNLSSLSAQRSLNYATNKLSVTYERLSSGLRINSAKDDPSGIQIANRLTTQIDKLAQGNRNAQDCISFAQTAEGALDEITTMLQRIRTLAIQSANGTNTAQDRAALQQEVDALNEEIIRIACQTTFAGANILNGDAGKVIFQVGDNPNSTVTIDMRQGFDTNGLAAIAQALLGSITLDDGNGTTYNYSDLFSNSVGMDISSASAAQAILSGIDGLILAVDTKRTELGAIQNRMEATISNQSNVSENVSDARSIIRDTDWAEETSTLTQYSIIQEATAVILTQANTRPEIALQLLADS